MIRKIILLTYALFFLNTLFGQNIGNTIFIGKHKETIIETIYYVFTVVSDTSIIVESYKDSKGQICYFDLFDDNKESYVPKLLDFKEEKVSKDKEMYHFLSSSSATIVKTNKGKWLFKFNGVEVSLELIRNESDKLMSLRNKSLLTFVYYLPNSFLGIELTPEENIKVKKIINDYNNSTSLKMNFDEFRSNLLQCLNLSLSTH